MDHHPDMQHSPLPTSETRNLTPFPSDQGRSRSKKRYRSLPRSVPSGSRFSVELKGLLHDADGHDLPLVQIFRRLKGRGASVIIIFFAIPFVFAIPIPLLSSFLGPLIMLLSVRVMFGQYPLVPKRILRYSLRYHDLKRIVEALVPWIQRLEKCLRPRMHFLQRWPSFRIINGATIFLTAAVLSLPVPIPASNIIPAVAIVLTALGVMEEDGVCILMGYGCTLITLGLVLGLLIVGKYGWDAATQWFW